MSADEIIITPEGSLSPFDYQMLTPDKDGMYFPIHMMMKIAKRAKRAINPFCIFIPRNMYKEWTANMADKTIQQCKIAKQENKKYPLYWLMKYMFKAYTPFNRYFTEVFYIPLWKRFTTNGRKANLIVNLFINLGIDLSHETPIMYGDMKNMGLNVSCADSDKELLILMRETYQLANNLFSSSSIMKLYTGIDKNFYIFKDNTSKDGPQ